AGWGGERRLYAAMKSLLFTLGGSALMLLAILALYYSHIRTMPAEIAGTFDVPTLLSAAQKAADPLKAWIFWGFFFAFAIRSAIFPFHTWLPDALAEAPTGVSILLAGTLLNTGSYGFLRFSLALLPADPVQRGKIVQILVVLS